MVLIRGSFRIHMHILLRVRKTDPFFIKGQFDLFDQIQAHRPVVFRFHPGTDHKVHTAVSKFGNSNGGGRIRKNPVVCLYQIFKYTLGFTDIVIVTNTHHQVDTSGGLGVDIGDYISSNAAVGNNDYLVVRSLQDGIEDGNAFYRARLAASSNVIPDLEGAEHDKHNSGGEVGQGILEGQTNCQAGSADNG